MDKLIERELLAAEADRLGYVVTDEEVEDQIAEAKIIGLGAVHTVPAAAEGRQVQLRLLQDLRPVRARRSTPKSFVDEQKKELLASRVRDLLRASVSVSPTR